MDIKETIAEKTAKKQEHKETEQKQSAAELRKKQKEKKQQEKDEIEYAKQKQKERKAIKKERDKENGNNFFKKMMSSIKKFFANLGINIAALFAPRDYYSPVYVDEKNRDIIRKNHTDEKAEKEIFTQKEYIHQMEQEQQQKQQQEPLQEQSEKQSKTTEQQITKGTQSVISGKSASKSNPELESEPIFGVAMEDKTPIPTNNAKSKIAVDDDIEKIPSAEDLEKEFDAIKQGATIEEPKFKIPEKPKKPSKEPSNIEHDIPDDRKCKSYGELQEVLLKVNSNVLLSLSEENEPMLTTIFNGNSLSATFSKDTITVNIFTEYMNMPQDVAEKVSNILNSNLDIIEQQKQKDVQQEIAEKETPVTEQPTSNAKQQTKEEKLKELKNTKMQETMDIFPVIGQCYQGQNINIRMAQNGKSISFSNPVTPNIPNSNIRINDYIINLENQNITEYLEYDDVSHGGEPEIKETIIDKEHTTPEIQTIIDVLENNKDIITKHIDKIKKQQKENSEKHKQKNSKKRDERQKQQQYECNSKSQNSSKHAYKNKSMGIDR